MSYTNRVKEEILLNNPSEEFDRELEIYAILQSKSAIYENRIELKLENMSLAKRVYKMLTEDTDLMISTKYSISKNFGEHRVYTVLIPLQKGFREYVSKLEKNALNHIRSDIPEIQTEEELRNSDISGYIRGIFLATGYIKEPQKEYALDFFIDCKDAAKKLYDVLIKRDKRVFMTQKRNKNLVYLRNSEDIMDVMVLVGAMKMFFEYEEVTMMKDLKNRTIREMNWEVANETKTLNTAQKQIRMIEFIDKEYGLENLSEVLQECAKIRLNNPESSLTEVAEVAGISKSGIRNRFRRLEKLHAELKDEDFEG